MLKRFFSIQSIEPTSKESIRQSHSTVNKRALDRIIERVWCGWLNWTSESDNLSIDVFSNELGFPFDQIKQEINNQFTTKGTK